LVKHLRLALTDLVAVKPNSMKQLSYWAQAHPVQARLLILTLHIPFALGSFLIGAYLYVRQVDLPGNFLLATLLVFLGLSLLYPGKWYRKVLVKRTFRNQKIFDTAILAVSFCVMIFIGNTFPESGSSPSEGYRALPIVEKTAPQTRKETREERRNLRQQWRQWKRDLRDLRKDYRQMKAAGEANLAPLWIVLTCMGFVLVWFVLIFLACTISCNGMETLGAVLMIGGTFLLIFLLIVSIRAILKKSKGD
jgi:hypothetical protein